MKIYNDLYQFTQNLSFMNFTIHQYLLLTEDPVLICTGTYQQAELILPEIKFILEPDNRVVEVEKSDGEKTFIQCWRDGRWRF